jgi:hypothetical protein
MLTKEQQDSFLGQILGRKNKLMHGLVSEQHENQIVNQVVLE